MRKTLKKDFDQTMYKTYTTQLKAVYNTNHYTTVDAISIDNEYGVNNSQRKIIKQFRKN
jgi:cupin superfamily acireductone dioxygenase involved in methionine salvage